MRLADEAIEAAERGLPEGHLIDGVIVVVSCISDDGEEWYGVGMSGDLSTSAVVGLMHCAAHDLLVARDEENDA